MRLAYSRLNGPIREFVPVLVEHMALDRLLQIVSHSPAALAYQEQLTADMILTAGRP